MSPDVNQDRPIPVDLVFVWDKKTAAKVEALSAKDWFEKKRQFRQEDPAERTLAIREWEWVPGQAVPDIDLEVRPAARRWLQAIFVFANYRSEGPHRFRVAPGAAALQLLSEDASVQRVDFTEQGAVGGTRETEQAMDPRVPDLIQWHEGLLLTPQHFQQLSLRVEGLIQALPGLYVPFGWGVRSFEVRPG